MVAATIRISAQCLPTLCELLLRGDNPRREEAGGVYKMNYFLYNLQERGDAAAMYLLLREKAERFAGNPAITN